MTGLVVVGHLDTGNKHRGGDDVVSAVSSSGVGFAGDLWSA